MCRTFLVVALCTLAVAAERNGNEQRLVQLWVENVQKHVPGTIDQPLRDLANQPPRTFDVVCRTLNAALKPLTLAGRNDIRRRGALAHTDIAMLLPERAAAFTQNDLTVPTAADPLSQKAGPTRELDGLVNSADGEYVSSALETAHWWMASYLLREIQPHPGEDPFVRAWSRAITAYFESHYLFGSAEHHLKRAFIVLPEDPVLLFYAGTLHDAYASASMQSVRFTRPTSVRELDLPPNEEWRRAEKAFRESVKAGGPLEARLRLARVKGQLGNHDEAATMLRELLSHLTDPGLQYLGHLFLGTEEGALGHVDESRQSFERAVRLQPTAQSPLLAIGEMYRRTGNLQAAQETLRRLAALPDNGLREDPYTDYFRSFAFDADAQLAALRTSMNETRR